MTCHNPKRRAGSLNHWICVALLALVIGIVFPYHLHKPTWIVPFSDIPYSVAFIQKIFVDDKTVNPQTRPIRNIDAFIVGKSNQVVSRESMFLVSGNDHVCWPHTAEMRFFGNILRNFPFNRVIQGENSSWARIFDANDRTANFRNRAIRVLRVKDPEQGS